MPLRSDIIGTKFQGSSDVVISALHGVGATHGSAHYATLSYTSGQAEGNVIHGDMNSLLNTLRDMSSTKYVTVTFTQGPTQDSTQGQGLERGQGQKRRREEGQSNEYGRSGGSQRTRIRSPDQERGQYCGNCHRAGHQARDCIKVGRGGWSKRYLDLLFPVHSYENY